MERTKILYVDDEPINLQNFTAIFKDTFDVITAESGEEALKLFLKNKDLAVVVTDQRMPGMSGVQLLSQIYQINPDPVRVIITGYSDFDDIIAAINTGHIYQYLQKPWSIESLQILLNQAVEKFSLTRENRRILHELKEANQQLAEDLKMQQKLEKERIQAELKMLSQSKMASLGEMATGVAHEINQPLSYIKIVIESTAADLSKGILDHDELAEDMQESLKQVYRISKIINQLRSFGRDNDNLEHTAISLPKVLKDTMILFSKKLQVNNISFIQDAEENLPLIKGNSSQLEQVFINLLQNAQDALQDREASEISVRFSYKDDKVITTFSDNGCGIPSDLTEKIFEPFFTTKDIGHGTGIGLAVVYGIIKKHEGTIECSSTADEGTSFIISLPTVR